MLISADRKWICDMANVTLDMMEMGTFKIMVNKAVYFEWIMENIEY